jgi:hypothetical protein
MKRFATAIALSCVLSGSALAGDMPTGGIAPPPPPTSMTQTTGFTSDVPNCANEQLSDPELSVLVTLLGCLAL